ncbi:hypothetical protein K440DRAFT_642128 [Wilcoxina mikolae CBS 423.85]|nr:hypothetical protein K440DRAFT_642128 [Wilcoxina mikolae CBS 423.85]
MAEAASEWEKSNVALRQQLTLLWQSQQIPLFELNTITTISRYLPKYIFRTSYRADPHIYNQSSVQSKCNPNRTIRTRETDFLRKCGIPLSLSSSNIPRTSKKKKGAHHRIPKCSNHRSHEASRQRPHEASLHRSHEASRRRSHKSTYKITYHHTSIYTWIYSHIGERLMLYIVTIAMSYHHQKSSWSSNPETEKWRKKEGALASAHSTASDPRGLLQAGARITAVPSSSPTATVSHAVTKPTRPTPTGTYHRHTSKPTSTTTPTSAVTPAPVHTTSALHKLTMKMGSSNTNI